MCTRADGAKRLGLSFSARAAVACPKVEESPLAQEIGSPLPGQLSRLFFAFGGKAVVVQAPCSCLAAYQVPRTFLSHGLGFVT